MDWEPRVGMRVVCVYAGPPPLGLAPLGLVKGRVYSIRSVGVFAFAGGKKIAVRLQEYVRGEDDNPVGAIRFRPLDERRLDIFRSMLTKVPTEKEPA